MEIIIYLLSLIPVLIIMWLLYYMDDEKESFLLLLGLFIGGCLSLILINFMATKLYDFDPDMLYGEISTIQQFLEKFALVAVCEEFAKWIILYFIVWRNKEFNHLYDGMIYAVYVSMGFAVVENFNYMMEYGDIMTLVSRSLLTVPAHACFGIMMGGYLADSKCYKGTNRDYYKYLSFFIPVILHGLYDFLLSFDDNVFVIFLVFFVIMVIMSIRKFNKYLDMEDVELIDEVKKEEEKKEDIVNFNFDMKG